MFLLAGRVPIKSGSLNLPNPFLPLIVYVFLRCRCDLDLPMECDDEFWDHPDPDRRFIQPVGKPSFMSFRICLLKISEILAFASRTLASIILHHLVFTISFPSLTDDSTVFHEEV